MKKQDALRVAHSEPMKLRPNTVYGYQGNQVAVGTHKGLVQVWDVASNKRVCVLNGHTARVGALAWNGDVLSSGSRDRLILQRDVRTPCIIPDRRLAGHRQEVSNGINSSVGTTH